MSEPVFLVALAIAASTLVLVARAIGGAIAGRRGSRADQAHLRERVEQQALVLEDTQASLAQQATQLAELQERLDFAERLLSQSRDRSALGSGEKPE